VTKLTPQTNTAETILVVEDQPATAQITRILLESWGYRVLEAHDGNEALSLFARDGDGIHLLLTDVIMPGMNGQQLASELVQRKPELRVVFMSGYPSDHLNQPNAAFLPKPFNPASLSRMVRKELDRPAGARRHMKSS
jgi:CheY-like chemotaxis protein